MEKTSEKQLTAEMLDALLRELAAAARKLQIYPPGHPASKRAAEKPYEMLSDLMTTTPELVFSIVEGKLVGSGVPLDDRFLDEGLGKVIRESGLHSISFKAGIDSSQLEKFLSLLNEKKEDRDIEGSLERNGITQISVDHVRYELVGDDEVVVSTDAAEAASAGDSSDQGGEEQTNWKTAVAEMLRDHPTTIMKMLMKSVAGNAPEPEDVGDADVSVDPETALAGLSSLDDDQLLRIMAATLQESVGGYEDGNTTRLLRSLFALKELLEEQDQLHLLPQLQEAVKDIIEIDGRMLELILSEGSTPKKVAHEALEEFRAKFRGGEIDPTAAKVVINWLEMISDRQYVEEFISKLHDDLSQSEFELSDDQRDFLSELSRLSADDIDSDIAREQLDLIKERLNDPAISLPEFRLHTQQLEVFYLKFLELERYEEAEQLLRSVDDKLSKQIVYADGIEEYAASLLEELTSAQVAERVMNSLTKSFGSRGKQATKLLEHFSSTEAILVLTGYIVHEDRGLRLMLLRVLSDFGEATIRAFRLIFSDKSLFSRPADQELLSDQNWYKLRNLILILGNIQHPDSVSLVAGLVDDRDDRVVTEMLTSLAKLGGDQSIDAVAHCLKHHNKEITHQAVRIIGEIGGDNQFPLVLEYFLRIKSQRKLSLTVLIKLDKQRTLDFLGNVLLGKSKEFDEHFSKPDEELNKLIVKSFIQVRSERLINVLKEYVKRRTGSILAQLRKPASVKLAEKYLKTISG